MLTPHPGLPPRLSEKALCGKDFFVGPSPPSPPLPARERRERGKWKGLFLLDYRLKLVLQVVVG